MDPAIDVSARRAMGDRATDKLEVGSQKVKKSAKPATEERR
jgi:hypothetical protein